MNIFFNILKKLETKIKDFFRNRAISFIDADFGHHDAIVDFLKTCREPENYLIFLLKKILNKSGSQKEIYSNTMALVGDKIIGFDSRVFFPNHYYWGSSVEVYPKFRKLGLARHLLGIGEKAAVELNIKKIRTAVVFSNIPVFRKLGFRKINPWYVLCLKLGKIGLAGSKFQGVREAIDSDLERLESFILKSNYFILTSRMYVEDLIWRPIDELWLNDLIKGGKVLLNESGTDICGVAIINKKSLINPFLDETVSIMEVGYFDGDCSAILNFIHENYHPDFLRIYSANGIPLKCLPYEMQSGYFAEKFNDLFGRLNHSHFSVGRFIFVTLALMEKTMKNAN